MISSTVGAIGDIVETAGYIAEDDGGGNRYIYEAVGAAADGGSRIDLPNTTPPLQAKGLFPGGVYKCEQWGAGPSLVDSYSAIQASIDYVESIDGGRLEIGEGLFLTLTQLRISDAVLFDGAGRGEERTAANPAEGVTTIRSDALSGVLAIQSKTVGNTVYAPSVTNMCLDSNNIGSIGLLVSSVHSGLFDNLLILRCVNDGMIISDGNGQISLSNKIGDYTYSATANVLSAESNGLSFIDNGGVGGAVQTEVQNCRTNTVNGDGIKFGGCDNNIVYSHAGFIQPGGTGGAVRFANGLSVNARNNVIVYNAGGIIKAENMTYGNRVMGSTSESGSVVIDTGGQLHYEANDYVNADLFKTHSYVMSDKQWISVSSMNPDGVIAVVGEHAVLWDAIYFPDSASGHCKINIPNKHNWNDGNIIGIDIIFATSTANTSANMRMFVQMSSLAVGNVTATPNTSQGFLSPVTDAINTINQNSFVFSTPQLFLRDDIILLRLERQPLDGTDTAIGNIELLGVNIVYESDGPNSPGSGPYDIPPPYI